MGKGCGIIGLAEKSLRKRKIMREVLYPLCKQRGRTSNFA